MWKANADVQIIGRYGIRRSGGSVRDPEVPAAGEARNRNMIDDDEFEQEIGIAPWQGTPSGEATALGRRAGDARRVEENWNPGTAVLFAWQKLLSEPDAVELFPDEFTWKREHDNVYVLECLDSARHNIPAVAISSSL